MLIEFLALASIGDWRWNGSRGYVMVSIVLILSDRNQDEPCLNKYVDDVLDACLELFRTHPCRHQHLPNHLQVPVQWYAVVYH